MQLHHIQSGSVLHLFQFLEGRLNEYADRTRPAGRSQSSYKLCGLLSINLSAAGREDEAEIIDRQMLDGGDRLPFRDSAYFNQWVHGISPCSHPM